MADLIGKTLGKCRILGPLGRGKTSTVFRAFYEPLGKEVAVKILKEDASASSELREKLLNEARALARLDHENIVKVFDVVEDGGYLFIIMELLKGRDVYQVLEEDGPIPAEQAVETALQIARALELAHRTGIVHRDVKPQNIMIVGRRGQAKLVDFGLATEGVSGGHAGTPHYMSPEQIQGKKVDEKSDVYSLGATLFHMLTGRPPYPGKTTKEILAKHLEGKLPTPSRANREVPVPKALDPVVKRMMAPVPGYRYPAKDLVSVLDDLNLASRGRARHTHAARAATRRNSKLPLVLAAVGIGAVAVVLVLVLLLTGGGNKTPAATAGNGGAAVPPRPRDLQELGAGTAPSPGETRAKDAELALRKAQNYAAEHYGKYDEILAEYRKVAEEYAGTPSADQAREKISEVGRQQAAEARAKEAAARDRAQREAQQKKEKAVADAVKTYDFATAQKAVEEYQFDWGESKELHRQAKTFEYAAQFLDALATGINERREGNKLPLRIARAGAPKEAVLKSADGKQVTIEEKGLERVEPWSSFDAGELERLAGRALSSRDAWTWCLLHAFYSALGRTDEAENMLQNGRGYGGPAASAKIDEYLHLLDN